MANTYITFQDSLIHFQKGAENRSFPDADDARSHPEIKNAWESMVKAWRAVRDGSIQISDTKYITDDCKAVSGIFNFKGVPHTLTIFQDAPISGNMKVRALQITNDDGTMNSYFRCSSVTSRWTRSTNIYLQI